MTKSTTYSDGYQAKNADGNGEVILSFNGQFTEDRYMSIGISSTNIEAILKDKDGTLSAAHKFVDDVFSDFLKNDTVESEESAVTTESEE